MNVFLSTRQSVSVDLCPTGTTHHKTTQMALGKLLLDKQKSRRGTKDKRKAEVEWKI